MVLPFARGDGMGYGHELHGMKNGNTYGMDVESFGLKYRRYLHEQPYHMPH